MSSGQDDPPVINIKKLLEERVLKGSCDWQTFESELDKVRTLTSAFGIRARRHPVRKRALPTNDPCSVAQFHAA
jgi:hypothetical protein